MTLYCTLDHDYGEIKPNARIFVGRNDMELAAQCYEAKGLNPEVWLLNWHDGHFEQPWMKSFQKPTAHNHWAQPFDFEDIEFDRVAERGAGEDAHYLIWPKRCLVGMFERSILTPMGIR